MVIFAINEHFTDLTLKNIQNEIYDFYFIL